MSTNPESYESRLAKVRGDNQSGFPVPTMGSSPPSPKGRPASPRQKKPEKPPTQRPVVKAAAAKPMTPGRGALKARGGGGGGDQSRYTTLSTEGKLDYSQIDDFAILLVSGALDRSSTYFYDTGNGSIDTVWDKDKAAQEWAHLLGAGMSPFVRNFLGTLSFIDLALNCIQPPTVQAGWYSDVGRVLEFLIILTYLFVVSIRFKYQWKQRPHWGKCTEPYWTVAQIVANFFRLGCWIALVSSSTTNYLQDGDWSTVQCLPGAVSFIDGWVRAWNFIYFHNALRDALVTLVKVFFNLGSLTMMVLMCFLGHFFVFQGLAVGVWGQNGFGLTSTGAACTGIPQGNCENSTPEVWTALYNLFGLVTTVNHPDVLMWLVDEKPVTFLFIMTYIFFTGIIAQNLLLGLVYGDYCTILEERNETLAKKRLAMVDTAYDILCEHDEEKMKVGVRMELMIELLHNCSGAERNKLDIQDGDLHEMIIRLVDNKTIAGEGHSVSQQDGHVDREDLRELMVFYNTPMEIKKLTKPCHRYRLEKLNVEKRIMNSVSNGESEKLKTYLQWMSSVSVDKWCATFPDVYGLMFEWGKKENPQGWQTYNPWAECSIPVTLHTLWILAYLAFSVIHAPEKYIRESYQLFLLCTMIMQTGFTILQFTAEMRRWEPYHFFNPNTKKALSNYSNFIFVFCLWLEFIARSTHGLFKESLAAEDTEFTKGICCVAKIIQIFIFMVDTKRVYLLVIAVIDTFENVTPHLGIFLAVFYGFAGMGIGMYCGIMTESITTGGPGFWGQDGQTPSTLASSGVPYGSTPYGGNPFYYNLNFNGYPQAVAILYAIMIQNNWNVQANGPAEVTSHKARWFFFVYCLIVAFVMINVLVGAIIDALAARREELLREQSGIRDPLEIICESRLATTIGPSGEPYSNVWELGDIPLHGPIRFDAALIPRWQDQLECPEKTHIMHQTMETEFTIEELKREIAELQEKKGIKPSTGTTLNI